jgi:mevalonate kinase
MRSRSAVGTAPGKVILIGDQFVIQGVPAVLAALPFSTVCTVEVKEGEKPGWTLDDRREEVPGYIAAKLEDQKTAMNIMIEEMGLADRCLHITLSGDLLAGSGVGASAANCVSFVRACSSLFNLGFDDGAVNYFAWRGEFGYHGLPSGLDNTVSTYGGTILYELHDGKKTFETLTLARPVEVVMGNSGVTADTSKLKGFLESQRDENPQLFFSRLEQVRSQVVSLKEALAADDLRKVGMLMNENHSILKQMGLSHPRLVELCDLANKLGAYGAKVTGGGRGGYMVALTPGQGLQERVAAAFEAAGVSTIRGFIT